MEKCCGWEHQREVVCERRKKMVGGWKMRRVGEKERESFMVLQGRLKLVRSLALRVAFSAEELPRFGSLTDSHNTVPSNLHTLQFSIQISSS